MLSRLRHTLVFALFLLLPFHALIVTAGTKAIAGQGHAPLPLLAAWKELLIMLILLVGILERMPSVSDNMRGIVSGKSWKFRLDASAWCVLVLLVIAVATSYKLQATSFIYGFKYVFVPLIFFVLLMTLQWEKGFLEKILNVLLIVGAIVAGYGILTFFLPIEFFTALGYSDAHSLYTPGGSLSAFQQISDSGIRRIQSTMSGPNQLGLWLLLPWSVVVVILLHGVNTKIRKYENTKMISLFPHCFPFIFLIILGTALLLTFSRSAWIAALVITGVAMWMVLKGRKRVWGMRYLVLGVVFGLALLWTLSPELIQRGVSNRHHFERTREGVIAMFQKPLGHGLGTAGPASNAVSDACLYFEPGADTSWARDRADLCLFVGKTQVQPPIAEKTCVCPVLPENWYVQIGYELGFAGFVLFVSLVGWLLVTLLRCAAASDGQVGYSSLVREDFSGGVVFLVFLGVSIAALFLHAWEDSAVAYTVWGLAGIAFSLCHAEELGRRPSVSKHTAP